MSKEKLQWFEEALLEVRKVTKVTTWWRRMRFRATVLVGDKWGNIGLWVAKGTDVSIAVSKATNNAYKNIMQVAITTSGSVPYQVTRKYKSCVVTLRPAGSGTGLKAWSSVRTVLEFAWYSNILSKIMGSNNPLNNALVVIGALTSFKANPEHLQATKQIVKATAEDSSDKKNSYKKDYKKWSPKPVSHKEKSTESVENTPSTSDSTTSKKPTKAVSWSVKKTPVPKKTKESSSTTDQA